MTLTDEQKLALAHRIHREFTSFMREEMKYQVESMKDDDELAWEYHLTNQDAEDITELVVDMIAVPVV